jgi:peptidoglycan LD-endopeptidase CwlK
MDRRIESLTPQTQELCRKLIAACADAGVPIIITSTLRTAAEQDRLYAQGRTAPGPIVTKLKGGQGIHETGQAFDVMPVNGGYNAPTSVWNKIGQLGESIGLEWGGNWKSFKDLPHFQIKGAKAGKAPTTPQPPAADPATGNASPKISEATNAEQSRASGVYVAKAPPIPNRLHNYATYTYGLSLHMLTNEEYNDVVITQKYIPKNVLIASAGRHSDSFPRNKHFNEDFYFNDLTVVTVIAPNDQSRNTNAIDAKFSIIEPYGFTLIERILAATRDLGGDNYLDMPYLLQIDFYAIDEAGNLVGSVGELQKRFPIKLTKLDVKLTEKGAEYVINATPFPHAAFEGNAGTVPCIIEVTAKTVADFFQSIEGTANDQLAQAMLAKADIQQRSTDAVQTAQTTNAPSLLYSAAQTSSKINVDSLGSAINAYYQGLVTANKAEIADVYRFEFLPDPDTGEDVIGKATFVEEKRNTPKETPMKKNASKADNISMRLSDVGNSQNVYDTTRAIFNINYGTSIAQILEYVIRNSSYIHDQLVIPDGSSQQEYQSRREEMKDKPLKWFRIIPKTRLLGKDKIRGIWAKEYTYTVKPYKMYNVRNDLAPQGVVVTPTKDYNYFFTGKNSDIINLDIQFNVLYYSQQTAFRNQLAGTAPTADRYIEEVRYQNAPNYSGGPPSTEVDPNSVMPKVMKTVSQNSRGNATGNPTATAEVAAGDVAESLMTSSQADMIGVKMRIIGDPDYIKQDDVFYQGNQKTEQNSLGTEIDSRLLPGNGSLVMDDGGVYVQVLFKIPRDIDDQTGFMKFDSGQRNSVFSGLYNVITVTSTFSQGAFTQELDMTRLPRQVAFDYVGSSGIKSNARVDTSSTSGVLGVAVAPPAVQADVVAGGSPPPSTADAADSATNQTAGQDQPAAQANNATPPAESQEQKDLKAVKDSAPTVAISEANQTPPNPPEPKPTEAKKAADKEYFDFIASNPSSPEKIAAANYDTLGSRIRSEQEAVETIQKNIERFDLRLARSDITEEQRKTFTELREKETVRLETRRRGIQDDEAERNLLKPVADAYNARVKELNDARANVS